MKKQLLILMITLLGTSTVSISATFSDIDNSNPYFLAINYLSKKEIISGYSDGSFKPFNNINRAELLKIVMEGTNITIEEPKTNCFPDVPYTEWYAKYICTAKTLKYINGYDDGTFKPSKNINKVETLKIIGEVYEWDLKSASTTKIFTDTPIDEWYAPYLKYAKSKNLLPESGGKYNPSNDITRGSVSETLFRLLAITELGEATYSQTVSDTIKNNLEIENQSESNTINENTISLSLTGKITDATTGLAIENAAITLYDAKNNFISNATSGKEGNFELELETNENNYLLFSGNEYYDLKIPVKKILEQEIHVSLSRIFAQINPEELRIILTWGNENSDFDAHLITPKEEEIFFMYRINPTKDALLDVDSTEKNGTETITIKSLQEGTYGYFIHNYSKILNFKKADVRVEVYDKNGLAKIYYAPEDDSEIWYIFTLNSNGEITDINLTGNCKSLNLFSSICPPLN